MSRRTLLTLLLLAIIVGIAGWITYNMCVVEASLGGLIHLDCSGVFGDYSKCWAC